MDDVVDPVVQDLLELAKPSANLENTSDHLRVQKHAAVLVDLLRLQAERFVQRHSSEPLIEQFFGDGTPLSTTETIVSQWDKFRVRRAGRACREYLVQRVFLIILSGIQCACLGDVRLMLDKTADTHYNAMRQLWKGARAFGHTGIVISHFVFDRTVMSAMRRRIRQFFAALEYHLTETRPEEAVRLILMSWVTFSGCAAHDFHNALKWGVCMFSASSGALG